MELLVPDTRLDVFRYLAVPDLGACLRVSRGWRNDADSHPVWVDAYDHTQRVDATSEPTGECSLKALIQRPFGEDAVGWVVSVLMEDGSDRHANGRIIAYNEDTDSYLIVYDEDGSGAPPEVWEQERRKRTPAMRHNPSLAGKSRFSFVSPPERPLSRRPDGCGRNASSTTGPLLRFSSWKQELENNARNAPSVMLHRLTAHRDEVLFVVFSPCGMRLASCSRDLRTIVFRLRMGEGGQRDWQFDQEAVFQHQTAPCRAIWWPMSPYNMVAVSTEDAGWQGASKVEIWEILTDGTSGVPPDDAADASDRLPVGQNARCIFHGQNRPFDIYAAIFAWPPPPEGTSTPASPEDLCFLAGWAVFRENQRYVQWLNIWPGPRHPKFQLGHERTGGPGHGHPLTPSAQLRLEGEMNYLHCLEVGPGAMSHCILAMTGSTPHLCDEIGLIDLGRLRQREDAGTRDAPIPAYDAPVEVHSMGERVVLSAKWNRRGDLLLLNTRPYARAGGGRRGRTASFEDLLLRPAPDLSTSMELLLLDVKTCDTIGVFDGHFAFTTKESPFLIFTDEWGDSDFLASGGEDHRVYLWHRRHRRLLRRLCGHTEPVNAVSWNGNGLLASASDDHTIIVWGSRPAPGHPGE